MASGINTVSLVSLLIIVPVAGTARSCSGGGFGYCSTSCLICGLGSGCSRHFSGKGGDLDNDGDYYFNHGYYGCLNIGKGNQFSEWFLAIKD